MPSKRPDNSRVTDSPERASRARQRQRLIDACISALHLYGPSRTTVEKVVSIAEMSPGIVRFYFDSKDAMLVASLAYLAAEFEERVMKPVARLQDTPVRALEQLVDLYLDPEIASPRKVSVWYSFWGEASSRKEYYEICGRKDDDFAKLVRELIERLIAHSGETHLDADAVALGLIGVLEVLWQGIAFTDEKEIDRESARGRSLAYLRSVFPRQFGGKLPSRPDAARVPAWAYADGRLLSVERDRLFRPAWQLMGHEAELARKGDYLAADLGAARVLVVRDGKGALHAFRNSCRMRPHALLTKPGGHLAAGIRCSIHDLAYGLDGRLQTGAAPGDLIALPLMQRGQFILVRGAATGPPPQDVWNALPPVPAATATVMDVAADWKLVVEQWLEAERPRPRVQRTFLAPNQLLELGPDSMLILQVIPEAAGKCRIRRIEYPVPLSGSRRSPAIARKSGSAPGWLQQDIEVAESTQIGLAAQAGEPPDGGPVSPALAQFRRSVAALLSGLEVAPNG